MTLWAGVHRSFPIFLHRWISWNYSPPAYCHSLLVMILRTPALKWLSFYPRRLWKPGSKPGWLHQKTLHSVLENQCYFSTTMSWGFFHIFLNPTLFIATSLLYTLLSFYLVLAEVYREDAVQCLCIFQYACFLPTDTK